MSAGAAHILGRLRQRFFAALVINHGHLIVDIPDRFTKLEAYSMML